METISLTPRQTLDRAFLIRAKAKTRTHSFNVPEWNTEVILRVMPCKVSEEVETFAARAQKIGDGRGLRVQLLSKCIVDEDGVPKFDDNEGRALLSEQDSSIIDRLANEARKMNGMTTEAERSAEGNLETTPTNSSITG